MKFYSILTLVLLLTVCEVKAQYTDVINSNRPGTSYSAYSLGTKVFQIESGLYYDYRDHSGLNTKANRFGVEYVLRYGFLFERLEIIVDGSYAFEWVKDNSTSPSYNYNQNNFVGNTVGLKYLIFDPYKKEENQKPNIYSWKANNRFQWKNLIPSVAVYGGINLNIGDNNPFNPNEGISPKVLIATQQQLTPRWVVVTNWIYNNFTADDPEFNYIITVTHALKNARYTVFAEHQGYKSDFYGDGVFRVGGAKLLNKDLQMDVSLGMNIKDTPSRYFGAVGFSYRIDRHKDKFKEIDNISDYEKKAIKEKKKKNNKDSKKEEDARTL